MPPAARIFRPEDTAAWDGFVLRHECGSPFHQTGWLHAIAGTFGYRPRYLLAESGGEIQAVLPLFLVRNPLLGRVLLSSPFAVYGGILASSDEARLALVQEVEALARRLRVDYVELRNAFPSQCAGFAGVSRYVTFTQEIDPAEDRILERIPRKTRYMVRKSLRHPFVTALASDWRGFFDLYSRSLRRLGTPCFPARHFPALLRHFPGQADIREVRLSGRLVAAVFSFYFRDRILPYYGASDPAYNESAPNNFMYFDQMRWGAANGYRVFDFGRSKIESGSFDFKAHWGMMERPLPYEILLVRRKELPHFSPNNPRFDPWMRAWRRIPLRVTQVLGPPLVKLVP